MKYFSIEELCRSETADAKGIDNSPSAVARENLEALVFNVLDPLREKFGKPIIVNSGYRSTLLNDIVGGARSSQHTRGEAADITAEDASENFELFEILRTTLPFDQLIWEKGTRTYPAWIHVSFKREGGNRQQILKIK